MKGLKVTKSLIGKEDVLLGRQTQTQKRYGGLTLVTPLNIIEPVYSIEELEHLDPLKHDLAFLQVDFHLATPLNEAQTKPVSEFYYFDFLNEEEENFPYVIKSKVAKAGRWLMCKVGEGRILDQIKEEVLNRTENLANVVVTRVLPNIEKLVEQETADTFATLRKQGGVYYKGENFSYDKNNFIQCFVEKEGAVYSKRFIVKEVQDKGVPLIASPLTGDIVSRINGVTIFKDNKNLKVNPAYQEILSLDRVKSPLLSVSPNTSYMIYTDDMNPSGRLKVKCLVNKSVSLYFEVVFSGISYKEFKISNVIYSPTLKRFTTSTQYGYPFFPLFAVTANSVYFGMSFEDTQFCDSVEFDYTEMNVKPKFESTRFISNFCYAIREGGGSYIPELGRLITDFKLQQLSTYASYDFNLFMSGLLPYTANMVIDPDIYHSYAEAKCLMTFPDLRNTNLIFSGLGTELAGSIQQPALPNVKWKGNLKATQQFVTDVSAQRSKDFNRVGANPGVWGVGKTTATPTISYDFNANRDCSSIYKDGETSVKTLSLYVNAYIVGY